MLDNNSAHDGETRILAFCWDQPALVESCTRLVEHISTLGASSACFITSGLRAKLLFLSRKIQAFTVNELCEATNNLPSPGLSPQDLSRLYEYDLRVGWASLPAAFGGDSPQGERESHHVWEAERIVVAYASLFDLIQPNVVFTWNGVALLQKALVSVAKRRGITTYFLERGLLPGTLVVDTAGVNYGSHVAGDGWTRVKFPDPSEIEVARAKRYCEELAVLGRSVVTRGERVAPDLVRERLNIGPQERIVLFPLQIELDSNILYYSPHYKEMTTAITDLEKALKDYDDVILVIKPHPEDRDRSVELVDRCGQRTRISRDLSVHSLLLTADVVVTVNSTVGLEALTLRKPVVVLGRAIYGEKGFTFEVEDPSLLSACLQQALDTAGRDEFNEKDFFRFLVYMLRNVLFPLTDNDPWGSKDTIGEGIIAKRKAGIGESSVAGLKDLLRSNRALIDMLQASVTWPTGTAKRTILVGEQPWLLYLRNTLENAENISILARGIEFRYLLSAVIGRYDYAVAVGKLTGLRRLMWSLLRAREKLQLL